MSSSSPPRWTMNYIPLLALLASSTGASLPRARCTVSVRKHLGEPQPLFLLQNEATRSDEAFPLPVDNQGTLIFAAGQKIDVACPGNTIVISGSDTGQTLSEARCDNDVNFVVRGLIVPFKSITCKKELTPAVRYTGKRCAKIFKEIEVGYEVLGRFIRHVVSCFNETLQNVVFTQHNLTSTIGGFQAGYRRPFFSEGNFYNVKPDKVYYLYSRNGQRKTINKLLGLPNRNTSIIKNGSSFYFARGHLVAKADFVYGSQQNLTFSYINTAPQWQTFNGGNWNALEGNCRTLASKRNLNLIVFTGTYGTATLPDIDGNEQPLYLWSRDDKKGIPVPAVYYRVLYDPVTKGGIALIGINNPYKKNVEENIYCEDVCNRITWLTWQRKNITKGYSYCCEVNDFRRVVKVLPFFEVQSLLT